MSLGDRERCVGRLLHVAVAMGLAACSSAVEEPVPVPIVEEAPIALAIEAVPPALADPLPVEDAVAAEPLRVRLDGEPTVLGAMAQDVFIRSVETHLPTLSKCARGSVEQPHVVVKVTITKDGTVSGATMRTPSGSHGVDRCLEEAFMDLRFPAPGAGLVVAAVPLDLVQRP